jgi:hypothetical protein
MPAHAHCLPLELAAELGVVGVAISIAAAVAIAGLARRLWPVRRELSVAIAVVPLHNLVDFSLFTSGVAVPWAILIGWGLAEVRGQPTHDHSPRVRLVLVTGAALAVALAALHATSAIVEEAASRAASPVERFEGASRARALAPWRISPVWLCGAAALDSGRAELAERGLAVISSSRWLRPRAASFSDLESRLRLVRGEVPHALEAAWSASEAQPGTEVYSEHLEGMLARLRNIDDGSSR